MKVYSRALSGQEKPHQLGGRSQLEEGGVSPPREARDLYHSQSPWSLETNDRQEEDQNSELRRKPWWENSSNHQNCSPWCV